MKVYISPNYTAPDQGDGGIRRVVEAQRRWLPEFGWDVIDEVGGCDLAAYHADMWSDVPVGVPVVAHCHGLYWANYAWSSGWCERVNRDVIRTMHRADAVTAPSEWVAYALARGGWFDAKVLYHGIEPDEWPRGSDDGYVLWNKTRPDPVCDETVVTALASRVPDVEFVTTFIDAEGEDLTNVRDTGRLPYAQAKEYVQGAGVYLATARETFGIGTLEAMCSGVPILGFNWGGQAEIVQHGVTGYLAEPGDYADLAKGLYYCLDHRARLGHAARTVAMRDYAWRDRIKAYADLYTRLCEVRKSRHKVTVVITNYNLGQYLPDCIYSVLASSSTIAPCVIVVDDASTEPIPDAVKVAPLVSIIRNQENKYLAESLNIGIAAANSEYVLALDADNRLAPGSLDVLVAALDADPDLDIAYGAMRVHTEPTDQGFTSEWPPAAANLSEQLAHRNQITSTALYRKKVWSRIGGYRRRCHTAEDADFWSRALALGFTGRKVTNNVVLEYLDRPDSMSRVNKDWSWNDWYMWAGGPDRSIGVGGPVRIYDKPLVSVVIPVGPGHERLVLDALDSIQAQSYSFWSWEAIVVNDTGGELTWVHPWVRVINSGGRMGVSCARNLGLDHARGEYILYLDADDFIHPDSLYHLYNTAHTSTCRSFVYSDWSVAESGEVRTSDRFDAAEVLSRLPYPVTCLYKRQDLIDHKVRFDEGMRDGWEDWDYALQIVAKAGLCGLRVPLPLLSYRLESGTLRRQAKENGGVIKAKVRDRWSEYIRGDKEVAAMGCGGCWGGRYPSIMSGVVSTGPFDGVDLAADTTMLEYTPPEEWGSGTRSFIGRVTGNRYRFSLDPGRRVRRVFKADAAGLVAMGFFVETNEAEPSLTVPPLKAEGPPQRADAA